MNSRSRRIVFLLLAFVFFSLAVILGFGFNLLLAVATFIAAQIAFMILWNQVKFRRPKNDTFSE